MPGIEDDRVMRRVEHPMQGDRQLHNTKVGSQMSPGSAHFVNQVPANLIGQLHELSVRKALQICRAADPFKHSIVLKAGQAPPGFVRIR
jgi:hypothetical protein